MDELEAEVIARTLETQPWLAKNTYLVAAVSAVVFTAPMFGILALLDGLAQYWLGGDEQLGRGLPLQVLFVLAVTFPVVVPLAAGGRVGSRHVVDSVVSLVREGKRDQATVVASHFAMYVQFAHWKKSSDFREFIESSGLVDSEYQYLKYANRSQQR
jgi:hypothetical protein